MAQHTNGMADLMKKYTLHKLNITGYVFTYLADCFWEDVSRIARHELGEEWYLNDDSCPCDQLSVIDDALRKYIRREFPHKTVKDYDAEEQEYFAFLDDDR